MLAVAEAAAEEQAALVRLQNDLSALGLADVAPAMDSTVAELASAAHKGAGPRLFCGHVPKDVTEEMVRSHFSRYGQVTDVYFPRHKKTLKRRPFCFVSFADVASAAAAVAEGCLEICGVPIKNLTMVDDRDKYYREKHNSARQALLQALQSLACPGGGGGSDSGGERSSPDPAAAAAEAAADTPRASTDQLASLAALLAAEGATSEAALAGWLQQAARAAGGAAGAQPPASSRRSSVSSMASSQLPMSHGPSLSLDGGLGGAPPGAGLPTAGLAAFYGGLGLPGSQASLSTLGDPRSTLSIADWACSSSTSPSARESVDALAAELAAAAVQQQQQLAAAAAAAAAAAQAAAAVLPPPVAAAPYEHRLSFDAAMQLQAMQQHAAQAQAQQLLRHRLSFQGPPPPATPSAQDAQLAALLAQQQQQQQAAAAAAAAYSSSLYQAAAAQQQATATAAMRSALYQPAAAAPGAGGVSLAMQSSLYAPTHAPAHARAPAVSLPAPESAAALAEPTRAASVPAAVQAALASAFYAPSSPPGAAAEAAAGGAGAGAPRASLGRPGGEGLPPLPRASSSRSSSPTQLPPGLPARHLPLAAPSLRPSSGSW